MQMHFYNRNFKYELLKKRFSIPLFARLFIVSILLFFYTQSTCQNTNDTTLHHEITVYIFAPAVPINWESPATLYKSVKKSYLSSFFHKRKRFLGHLAFSIKSSLIEKPLYISISAADKKGFFKQLFQRKIGLGILGYPFKGGLETDEYVLKSLNYHSKKNKLARITYQINEAAVKRVLAFIQVFTAKQQNHLAPSNYYGGAFWPLYENEGAGCSALTLAALEVAGIPLPEKEAWKITCKIPISLIGGTLDENKKVALRKIKNTTHWFNKNGVENTDFVSYEIFDPNLLWHWFQKKLTTASSSALVKNTQKDPVLNFDYRSIIVPKENSIFTKRPVENFFLHHYLPTINIKKNSSASITISK